MMIALNFIKTRKKIFFWTFLFIVFWGIIFKFICSNISIVYTVKGQECFPYKLWFVRKGILPSRGEYVVFKNSKVNGRTLWIKVISGKEGDYLEVIELSNKERFKIFIEEINKELTVRGFVILYPSNPFDCSEVFEVFEKDTCGRALPIISGGRIPPRKYFVTSPALRSYDSRYWGLVDESEIIGKAYPIF